MLLLGIFVCFWVIILTYILLFVRRRIFKIIHLVGYFAEFFQTLLLQIKAVTFRCHYKTDTQEAANIIQNGSPSLQSIMCFNIVLL